MNLEESNQQIIGNYEILVLKMHSKSQRPGLKDRDRVLTQTTLNFNFTLALLSIKVILKQKYWV